MSGLAEATAALRQKDSEKTKIEEEISQLEVIRCENFATYMRVNILNILHPINCDLCVFIYVRSCLRIWKSWRLRTKNWLP